ncbi:glycerol-3-phosphate 1-O-acyltransferase [Ectothiorhodospiraceae bacterium BW-2]|nr:glycerol-3-phosphate 1-O-acyltransferase [Ectothiorhodospiraceae bacterium BW-2]
MVELSAIVLLLPLAAYLIGSLSAAIIVCRLMGLPDPRTQGSHNPGATNVLRIGGKKAAAVTLLGDMVKGVIPVGVGLALGLSDPQLAAVGLAALLGHLWPLFFGFRGGKGVATAFGVILVLAWPVALAALLTWLVVAKLFRISSLAALIAALLTPLYGWWFEQPAIIWQLFVVISLLLLLRHRQNIRNLLSGQEGALGR